jgi:hypothetical protein
MSVFYLYGRDDDGQNREIGEVHALFSNIADEESAKIIEGTIEYWHVQRLLPELVQLIANKSLYFEHIPNNADDARHITVARVILNTAAFEWTFGQYYKDLAVSEYRTQVKNDIVAFADEMLISKNYNSKARSEIKKYKKIILGVDSVLVSNRINSNMYCH